MKPYEVFGRQVFSLSPRILDVASAARHSEILTQLAGFEIIHNYQPESLAVNKLKIPPGGSVHDYYSQGAYWFPDPTQPDGLPYINRDGVINPEAENEFCDKNRKNRMFARIYPLATLFFFTRNDSWADQAARLLRHWFLNPSTRMNPNVNYGQAIPGRCTGRDAGIIEFHSLIQIVDALAMLDAAPQWTDADRTGMKAWLGEFLDWLQTSKIGIDESHAPNNHGTWHAALCLKLASWCGRTSLIGEYVELIKQRITRQIMPDGTMPEELRRTQSWHYSLFGTSAFLAAATAALDHGEDLFNYRTPDGVGIRTGIDFLASFAAGEREWPYPELYASEFGKTDFGYQPLNGDPGELEARFRIFPKTWPCPELYGFLPAKMTPILHSAAFHYRDERYLQILRHIPVYEDAASRLFMT